MFFMGSMRERIYHKPLQTCEPRDRSTLGDQRGAAQAVT